MQQRRVPAANATAAALHACHCNCSWPRQPQQSIFHLASTADTHTYISIQTTTGSMLLRQHNYSQMNAANNSVQGLRSTEPQHGASTCNSVTGTANTHCCVHGTASILHPRFHSVLLIQQKDRAYSGRGTCSTNGMQPCIQQCDGGMACCGLNSICSQTQALHTPHAVAYRLFF